MMSPFDDTAGMASEQSSREVRPLVAALTSTMSDGAIRAAFRICITVCCLSVRSWTYCRCGWQKTTTRATQSEMVVRLSFLLREHRLNKSRQAQILERGASRSAAVIRHHDQFEHGDIREFNLVFLDFAYRARGAEIPLLAHDFTKRASAIRRPPQDELLGAFYRGFLEDERDARESLRLIED